ncbi:hypothetical protein PLICRDRAFT_178638 [Plicaturopsis crispa FD-325 SS-3]|nr:hypothetical protein PLICRDRAFT_178638 [Plicaturopsis crispa FD-325 SS-3]
MPIAKAAAETVSFDLVSSTDIDAAHKIETDGFPPSEAASLDAFRYRQKEAGDLFLGAYLPTDSSPRTLVGYVCATLSPDASLTAASMSHHVPGAPNVCIHSICVAPTYRRTGIALRLLQEYVARLDETQYERVLLITHEELRGLYERAGFQWGGKSAVVHGDRPWFEMHRDLRPQQAQQQEIPPGVWEALQRPSRPRPGAKLLTDFQGGIAEVTTPSSENKFDILCPRDGCGSIILKAGAAKHVEGVSFAIDPPSITTSPLLAPLPPPPEHTHWWRTGPTVMAFENIGFSKRIPQSDGTGPGVQLLACAECDLGPLGWAQQGGKEFWVACTRVGYRVD